MARQKPISGTATSVFVGATALAAVWLASGSLTLAPVNSSLPTWASLLTNLRAGLLSQSSGRQVSIAVSASKSIFFER